MSVKCPISIEIKSNKHSMMVAKYGAVVVQKTADISMDEVTMTSTIKVRNDAAITTRLGAVANDVMPSYIFSNSKAIKEGNSYVIEKDIATFLSPYNISFNGVKALSTVFDEKRKLISSVLPEGAQSILEVNEKDTAFESMPGDFFRLTAKDIEGLKTKARFHARDGAIEDELIQAENDFISATIVSALYRGFNVLLPGTIVDKKVVLDAKKKFKNLRKAGSNPVFYASQYQKGDPDIIGFSNAKAFLTYAAKSINVSDLAVEGKVYVSLIDSALSKREKLFIERVKKVGYRSRIYVANSIIDVFKKFIPNLDTEFLTQSEIESRFGSYFVNKKGFIIEGKLYFNLDKFTIDTVFHEFGHYYMKWMKESDPVTHRKLLDKIKETHAVDLAAYKKIYKNLDLLYTDDILLEEIFVDKIGLKALDGLIKALPEESKRAKAFITKTSFKFNTKKVELSAITGLPVYSKFGINALRINGTVEHFGNFFTGSLDSKKSSFIIDNEKIEADWPIKVGPYKHKSKSQLNDFKNKLQKLANIREAVRLYEGFITGSVSVEELIEDFNLTPNQIKVLQAQKAWIINQLIENTFDSLDVLYYESALKYTSHADVLSSLLSKYSTIEESFLDYSFTPDVEVKEEKAVNTLKKDNLTAEQDALLKKLKPVVAKPEPKLKVVSTEFTALKKIDKNAVLKDDAHTKFIGFAEGIKGSSTAHYNEFYTAKDGRDGTSTVNTGEYTIDDIVFVSVTGKRGMNGATEANVVAQQEKTVAEAIIAIEAGATLLTDPVDYIHKKHTKIDGKWVTETLPHESSVADYKRSGLYNIGEKMLYNALKEAGYTYEEMSDGKTSIGVWFKVELKPSSIEEAKKKDEVEAKTNSLIGTVVEYKGEAFVITAVNKNNTVQILSTTLVGPASKKNVSVKNTTTLDNKTTQIEHKGAKYLVTEDFKIISLTTARVMKWGDANGDRRVIIRAYEEVKGNVTSGSKEFTSKDEVREAYRKLSIDDEASADVVYAIYKNSADEFLTMYYRDGRGLNVLPNKHLTEVDGTPKQAAQKIVEDLGYTLDGVKSEIVVSESIDGKKVVFVEISANNAAASTDVNKDIKYNPIFNTQHFTTSVESFYTDVDMILKGENVFTYKGVSIDSPHKLGFEQEEAIKGSIDYILGEGVAGNFNTLTIQGSAGTGKTTIVGLVNKWFKKAGKGNSFSYSTPTHAANATLAFANAAHKIKIYPSTVKTLVRGGYPTKVLLEMMKVKGAVLVIDEASMLDPREVEALRNASSKLKIIYMGDPIQLPSITGTEEIIDGKKVKRKYLSEVFSPEEAFVLNTVYRQDKNTLLKVLNRIKKNVTAELIYIKDGDGTYQVVEDALFESMYLEDFKNDTENTAILSYTNKSVKKYNNDVKEELSDSPNVAKGDKILGYIGAGVKKPGTTSGALNSISYKVENVDVVGINEETEITTAYISLFSNRLHKLIDLGYENIQFSTITQYIPLSDEDGVKVDGVTDADYAKNSRLLYDKHSYAINGMLSSLQSREPNWKKAEAIYKIRKEAFNSLDLGAAYMFNPETQKVELFNYSKLNQISTRLGVSYNLLEDALMVSAGLNYGYAMTVHKSQGMGITNTYVDPEFLNFDFLTDIIGLDGKVFNTEANSAFYTAVSRGSGKTVVRKSSAITKVVELSESDLETIAEKEKTLVVDITDSIEQFVSSFVENLIGVSGIDHNAYGITLDSKVSKILDVAINDGGENSTFMANLSYDGLNSIKEFVTPMHTLFDVFNALKRKGRIRKSSDNRYILLDADGNFVDGNNKIIDGPTEHRIGDKDVDLKISNFLMKNRDIAAVLFSIDSEAPSLAGIALAATEKIVLVDEEFYMNDGVKSERATQFLSDTFKDGFDRERAIMLMVYNNAINDYKFRNRNKDYTIEELEAKAYEYGYKFIEDKDAEYDQDTAEVNTLFDFKTEEGTYSHAIAELFTRALNYSMKLPYPAAPTKRSPLYFMKQISAGISKTDRGEFIKYFDKYFFSFIEDTGSHEYKEFVKAYEFIKNNMDTESAAVSKLFLKELTDVFKTKIFDDIPGPVVLIPELRLGSKVLGVAGTIDLVVFDRNGYAHIFDYKNKKEGDAGRKSWEFSGGNNLKDEMSDYKDNAFMAASMQTSLYKIFFAELGIKVAKSYVIYVENEITSATTTVSVNDPMILSEEERRALYSTDDMRYSTTAMNVITLVDVSSKLYAYAERKGLKLGSMEDLNQDASSILHTVKIAAGGVDIDISDNIEVKAQRMYDEAVASKKGFEKKRKNQRHDGFDLAAMFGGKTSKGSKGMRIYLDGDNSVLIDSSLSEEQAVKNIIEMLVNRKDIAALEGDFEKTFLSLDRNTRFSKNLSRSRDKDAIFKRLLSGTDSSTWGMTKFSDDINFGNLFGGIVMLTNKNTNETRVVILNHDYSRTLHFGDNRGTVFGNYETNGQVLKRFNKNTLYSNTHDMRVFKAGLAMLLHKQNNSSFVVSTLIRNSSLASDAVPEFVDVDTTLKATYHMLKLMVENGENLPPVIQKLFDNKALFDAKTYQPDPINALKAYIDILISGDSSSDNLFTTKGGKEDLARLKEVVDNFDPLMDFSKINSALHKIKAQLERSLPTEEAKINNDMWNLLDEVTVSLAAMNRGINPENTTVIGNFMFTPAKAANFFQAFFNQKITESRMAIRQEFIDYKVEMNSEIAKLAAAKNINISMVGPALYKSSMKEVFSNLYVDPDHKDRKTAYTLKKLSDSSLLEEDRRFLRYYYKTMKTFTKRSIFNAKEVREGWMLFIRRSNTAFLSRVDDEDITFEKASKRAKKLFAVSPKGDSTEAINNDKEFFIHNKFEGQLPHENKAESLHQTYERRRILGIDEFGNTQKDAINLNMIEDNLEAVMDTYVVASLNAIYYRDASALGRSMYYIIKKREAETGESLDDLIKTLVLTQRRVILGESSQEGEKLINGVNKFATFAVIGGAIPQAILEAVTNPAITGSNFLADLLYGTLFKGKHRKFSAKSYAKAIQIVWTDYGKNKDLVKAIDRLYGFSNSDTRDLKRLMSSLNKFGLFKTDNLMYVNHLMLTNWQQITMVAFMIEEGSFFAHSLDSSGNLVYNQDEDGRFNTTGKSAEQKLDIKKRLYKTKEQLAKEPLGLGEGKTFDEKRMARAYTHFDVNRLKHLIVELYAGIDEAAKSLASYYTFMALITKMRFWLFPKMSRYFNKPMSAEENIGTSRLLRIEDETQEGGYRYEWRGEETEGILYSIVGIGRELAVSRMSTKLTEIQKVNMGKVLADVFTKGLLWAAAIGFFVKDDDDDEFTAEMKKLMHQRLIMAGDDVFLLRSIYTMSTGNGSMFIGPSIAARAASSMFGSIGLSMQYTVSNDISGEDVLQSFNESLKKSLAIYKTVETIKRGVTQE